MNDQKLSDNKIALNENKFFKWLDNYWYHYKWPTIVVAFFVVVFSVCFVQACTHEEKDILITYAGPTSLAADEIAGIERLFTENLPEAFGNQGIDGKAGLVSYIIYSKEQIKELESKKNESEDPVHIDTVFNSNEYNALNSQYKTGNGSIYLLDRWLYDELVSEDNTVERLKPLAEIFGEKPVGAIDKYGIRLGDTEIYKNSIELQVLPADTIICLHEQIVGQRDYDKEIEAFKKIAKLAVTQNDTKSDEQ